MIKKKYLKISDENNEEEELTALLEINRKNLSLLLKANEREIFEKYIACFEELFAIMNEKEFERGFKEGGKFIAALWSD